MSSSRRLIEPYLVGHWSLNGHAKDLVGGNHGTWVGAAKYAEGFSRHEAADFDSTTRIATTAAALRFEGVPFTSAFWIKPTTLTNFDGFCGATLNGSYPDGWGWYWNANAMYFFLGDLAVEIATTALTLDGTWHHFCGTFDGAQIEIYKDAKAGTGKANTTGATATAGNYWMGALGAAGGSNCDAKMLDNRLYNVALTADEVAKLTRLSRIH